MNIVIENYGCTANQNDAEIMAGQLEKAGYTVILGNATKQKPDIAILNTCVVKGPTLKRMERRIKDILMNCNKLIVTGCMASAYPNRIIEIKEKTSKKFGKKNIALIPPENIKNIIKVVNKIKDNDVILVDKKSEEKVNLPKKKINRVIGITQIASGCSSFCSFCVTKLIKGRVKSYSINSIVESIKQDVREGSKEILLTATDTGCYGLDKGKYMLVDLLNKITEINGRFLVRVGMMNPEHVKNFIDSLLDVYQSNKIFKFLHLPLQSASNRVLEEMKRKYDVKEFLDIVKKFRKKFPNATLATDIIVGFYNETEDDFNKTLKIIKKVKPEIINISRFWPMPNTIAFKRSKEKIKEIEEISKKRAKKLMEISKKIALEKNKKLVDKETLVLVDKKGYDNSYLARDINYKLVAIKEKVILGKFYKIEIKKARSNFVIGKIKNN